MLDQLKEVKAKWGGKSDTIDNWLQERQLLLVHYCHLAGLDSPEKTQLPNATDIGEFCTILMDYLSAGHFEVYDMLVAECADGQALKDTIYPRLTELTDSALDFNDQYADGVSDTLAAEFDRQLAALGEILEERFELEDQLIQHMHQAEPAAAAE